MRNPPLRGGQRPNILSRNSRCGNTLLMPNDDPEIYPNSPLDDVACEIRFPGEMAVECNRHLFWEQIREEYPQIRVPKVDADAAPALQHYRFCSASGTRRVAVALNSLGYSDTKYPGHEAFLIEMQRITDIFRQVFPGIRLVNRVGWRYINLIPFARESGLVPIKRILKADLLLPHNALDAPKVFDIRVETQQDGGTAIFRLATVAKKSGQGFEQEALLLDIDFGCDAQDMEFKDYLTYIHRARRHNRQLFDEIITSDYRKYLRGETL